ncbi:MAG: phospho-sugar mutase [Firmicutes bacterium]|nr:phospho-sugar mutase [Bacillota bacterium]
MNCFEHQFDVWYEKLPNSDLFLDLDRIKNNKKEIFNRFYKKLDFGTAGIRGKVGAGINRVNIYTVASVTCAFSFFLNSRFKNPSVVISYDTRKNSFLFANTAAKIFIRNKIKVFIFPNPEPIPILSFAIRKLKCSGGVMITASHNPPEYNGYKVYDSHGAQPSDVSEISQIFKKIDTLNYIGNVEFDEIFNEGDLIYLDFGLKEEYIKCVTKTLKNSNNLNVTYSPLNGCSFDLFYKLMIRSGISEINVVEEQRYPDENFPTCRNPDPQNVDVFDISLKLASKKKSDVVIINDPDGDRLGIAVRHMDSYRILTGNEIAALFLNYLVEKKVNKSDRNEKFLIIKSIVSGCLIDKIAKFNNIVCKETLPGFKYIAKQINDLECENKLHCFLMGFEESHGYLLDNCVKNVRDKDGLSSAIFFCEMVSEYKQNNKTCVDVIDGLYDRFGYYIEKVMSFEEKDQSKIKSIMSSLRKKNSNVISVCDYVNLESDCNKNESDIVLLRFKGDNKLIIRPSGTESLIKFYILSSGASKNEVIDMYKLMENFVLDFYSTIR